VHRAYHLHVPIVLKSGRMNLQEPYEPVQACNGISLTFIVIIIISIIIVVVVISALRLNA
jgi:heme/copper-type cytochrome/quinol oxidase subunit 2